MPTLTVIDSIENNDQTEILLPKSPNEIEKILDTQANVLMKSVYRSSYEYVIGFEKEEAPISITFCETDDTEKIQTEYNLSDFIPDEEANSDEEETINTIVFSQASPDVLADLFTQYSV